MFGLTLPGLIASAIAFLFGFTVHEAAHAWAAYQLGDDTARRAGRLTLNPLVHIDPLGYILAIVMGFGWARPTPVNPWRLRLGPRVGNALVSIAGPISNLLLAVLAAIPWRLGLLAGSPALVQSLLYAFVIANVTLLVFNLIPLPPLDGFSVLLGLVGARAAEMLQPLRNYGQFILMGLILLPYIVPRLNILGGVLFPAILGLSRVLIG